MWQLRCCSLKKKIRPQHTPIFSGTLETNLGPQTTHLTLGPVQSQPWPALPFTFFDLCHSGCYCLEFMEPLHVFLVYCGILAQPGH